MPCFRGLLLGSVFGAMLAYGGTLIDFSGTPEVIGGATAVCRDGAISLADNRSGACSHHGGVKQWME